jgi:signal transduction histidine kinase
LLRWLGRKRGQAAAMQDLRNLLEIARFASLFAVTILLPMALLSVLAVSSIGGAETALGREMRARADALVASLAQAVDDEGEAFRVAVVDRLARRESLLEDQRALSPELRAVFRFDPDGTLRAPFERWSPPQVIMPPAAWVALQRRAEVETAFSRHNEAGAFWQAAAASVDRDTWVVEAELGAARAAFRAGDRTGGRDRLALLYGERIDERDSRGMRVSDVAALGRAEALFSADPTMGATALQEFVLNALESRWTIHHGGEAAMLRRALRHLDSVADAEWLGRTRKRVEARADEQFWAGLVADEIDALDFPDEAGVFLWHGDRPGSVSLWATMVDEQGSWAFSLSAQATYERAQRSARQMATADPDLAPVLLLPGAPVPRDALAVGTLGQRLPSVRVAVVPDDTGGLDRTVAARRQTRLVVILLAVFVFVAGLVLSARIVSREIEGARMKADFAANVSHELRSPITQIRLKGEALRLGLVDPGADTEAHHDAIIAQAERLSRLVDNVLDYAAIERGAKKYTMRRDDLRLIVLHAVDIARRDFETRGLTIQTDLPDAIPHLMLDREAIGQVLVNLLSNAAKYGGDAQWVGVTVSVGQRAVELLVADRGIGIAREDLPRLFEHFFRSSDPEVRRRKGTGIGLTIVRYIVQAHGGSIAVDSEPGRGTTFTVTLPRPEESIEGGPDAANPVRRG